MRTSNDAVACTNKLRNATAARQEVVVGSEVRAGKITAIEKLLDNVKRVWIDDADIPT